MRWLSMSVIKLLGLGTARPRGVEQSQKSPMLQVHRGIE
jgi:hypothetical protein